MVVLKIIYVFLDFYMLENNKSNVSYICYGGEMLFEKKKDVNKSLQHT